MQFGESGMFNERHAHRERLRSLLRMLRDVFVPGHFYESLKRPVCLMRIPLMEQRARTRQNTMVSVKQFLIPPVTRGRKRLGIRLGWAVMNELHLRIP